MGGLSAYNFRALLCLLSRKMKTKQTNTQTPYTRLVCIHKLLLQNLALTPPCRASPLHHAAWLGSKRHAVLCEKCYEHLALAALLLLRRETNTEWSHLAWKLGDGKLYLKTHLLPFLKAVKPVCYLIGINQFWFGL